MGAWVDVHTIQTGTGTSAIVKSGLPGTPVGLLFVGVLRNGAGTDTDLRIGFGCATGAAERWAQATFSLNGAASADAAKEVRDDSCFVLLASATTEVGRLDLTSLDADGYTLAVDAAFLADTTVLVLAFGGSDFTNAKAFTFPCNTATGNYAVTTPGFQPTWNLFGGVHNTGNINTIQGGEAFDLGVAVSSAMRWMLSIAAGDNLATMNTSGVVSTAHCFANIDPTSGAGAVINYHDFVSQDATGFTLNRLQGTSARSIGCLSVQGGQVFAGTTAMRTDTNDQVVTAPGFPVLGLLVATHPEATASEGTTVSGSAEVMVGLASGPTQRGGVWVGDKDGVADADTDSELSTTRVALNRTVGTVADQGTMDLASLDATGFTLDQITAGSVALLLPYLAIGANAGGTTYDQVAAGGLTPAAALARRTGKGLGGGLTPSAALRRQTGKLLAGALTPAGVLAAVKIALVSLAGALTPAGALLRRAGKALAGALTPNGTLLRTTVKMLAGALAPGADLVRQTGKVLAGALSPAGAVGVVKTALVSLARALAPAGTLLRQTGKVLAGSLAPAGTLRRTTLKILAGALTPAAVLTTVKAALVSLAGSLAPTGALGISTGKRLAGALAPAGSLARQVGKALGGTFTPAGTLSAVRTVLMALAGLLVPTGTLRKRTGKALAGGLAPSGALSRSIGKVLAVALAPIGTLVTALTSAIVAFLLSNFGTSRYRFTNYSASRYVLTNHSAARYRLTNRSVANG